VGVAVDRWLTASVRQANTGTTDPEFVRSGTLATLTTRDSQDAIYVAFRAAVGAKKVPLPERLRFTVTSEIPVSRGLGSSAAAFVAGAALANEMLKLGLDSFGIAEVGTALEGHPDNVCPSVFGGATLALTHAGTVIVSPLEVHPSLAFVFAVPEFVLETRRAREGSRRRTRGCWRQRWMTCCTFRIGGAWCAGSMRWQQRPWRRARSARR
jgi:homoserine kinase